MSDPDVPAGWYPDGYGAQRWWDGTRWTEHTLPLPPPTQPLWPAYGDPSARAPRSRRTLILAVGAGVVVLVLLLVLALVLVLAGRSGPGDTVQGAFKAFVSGDCHGYQSRLTVSAQGGRFSCAELKQESSQTKDLHVAIDSSRVDGDQATVTTTQTITPQAGPRLTERCRYALVRQHGDWLIDGVRCGAPTS